MDSDESIILLFLRTERESFIKKYLAFNPSSLYKVDLQRVLYAGREVREETQAEDVKTARWLEHFRGFLHGGEKILTLGRSYKAKKVISLLYMQKYWSEWLPSGEGKE